MVTRRDWYEWEEVEWSEGWVVFPDGQRIRQRGHPPQFLRTPNIERVPIGGFPNVLGHPPRDEFGLPPSVGRGFRHGMRGTPPHLHQPRVPRRNAWVRPRTGKDEHGHAQGNQSQPRESLPSFGTSRDYPQDVFGMLPNRPHHQSQQTQRNYPNLAHRNSPISDLQRDGLPSSATSTFSHPPNKEAVRSYSTPGMSSTQTINRPQPVATSPVAAPTHQFRASSSPMQPNDEYDLDLALALEESLRMSYPDSVTAESPPPSYAEVTRAPNVNLTDSTADIEELERRQLDAAIRESLWTSRRDHPNQPIAAEMPPAPDMMYENRIIELAKKIEGISALLNVCVSQIFDSRGQILYFASLQLRTPSGPPRVLEQGTKSETREAAFAALLHRLEIKSIEVETTRRREQERETLWTLARDFHNACIYPYSNEVSIRIFLGTDPDDAINMIVRRIRDLKMGQGEPFGNMHVVDRVLNMACRTEDINVKARACELMAMIGVDVPST